MDDQDLVSVRLFGMLRELRRQEGLVSSFEVAVPPDGIAASEIAEQAGLPIELIEGVFCNHIIRRMDHVICAGDSIAFVPHGTPGPHRFFLGLYEAGKELE